MPKIIIVIFVIIFVGIGAYYLGTKDVFQPDPSLTPSTAPTAEPTPMPSPSPLPSVTPAKEGSASPSASLSPALFENIKSSVVSKNTAALEGYMTDTVAVTIEATECCGNLTPVKAIHEIDYILDATPPWNFADDNPIALALKQKNPVAFPDGIILGTSTDRKLITFTLNPEKTKIIKVYMAIDYNLHGI